MHPYFQGSIIYNSQDRETTKLSIDRKMKMLYRYKMEHYSVPGAGGWSQDMGAWASDQQVRARRKTSPEGRGSLKSVSPGALMGFIPSGDMSGACSGSVFHLGPFDEAMAALGPEVSWRCFKLS